jgi:uncharacterized protein YneF (UPF0154 family)
METKVFILEFLVIISFLLGVVVESYLSIKSIVNYLTIEICYLYKI